MKATLLVFAAFMQIRSTEAAYGYFFSDQDNWKDADAGCGGEEQSPIDIITADTIHDSVLDTVPFEPSPNFYDAIENLKCTNTGQSYTCDLSDNGAVRTATKRTMSGGGLLGGDYWLWQFHVHFGSSTSFKGSEHRVDSYQYPAEIHYVFVKDEVTDKANLANYGDLAVWGFFIEVLSNGHEKLGSFDKILEKIDEMTTYNDERDLSNEILLSDMIPLDYSTLGSFYRYKGGLTTPGCNELVQWTVFKNPIYISEAQYNKMTGGKAWPATEGDTTSPRVDMINTFRKPQPLNGRPVTRSLLAGDAEMVGSSKVDMHSSVLCFVTLAVAKLLLQ